MADLFSPQNIAPSPTGPPPKRKHSLPVGEDRVIKHRSSKACRQCRSRKVRCDVSAKGSRCTNCELDQVECVVLPSRRGQSSRVHRRNTITAPEPQSLRLVAGNAASDAADAPSARALKAQQPVLSPEDQSQVPAVVTFDDDGDNETNDQEARPPTDRPSADAYEALLTPETVAHAANQPQIPAASVSLPSFIAPLPTRLLPEDLEFLRRKGAFGIPETDLCTEIFRAYQFSVHPFQPMLEVGSFSRALLRGDGKISLLLFQAVMFAGLHSLQSDVVQRLGFQSPKQARETFFDRVRLLYDFNVESDNAAIMQALILMSSWYSKHSPWNERRQTWHWTGLAYDLARTMGLHREPSGKYALAEGRKFRRRLWWSLYIRDRLIALGTRRPMRILDEDFDVAMLSTDDFDAGVAKDQGQVAVLSLSTEENNQIALMCIQLARLCVSIGRVVSSQYTILSSQPGASHSTLVMPKHDGDGTTKVESCERELHEWLDDLPNNVRRPRFTSATTDPASCSEVHWAQLNMTYLTVVNVLHRARALQLQTQTQSPGQVSRSKVKEAARSITRLGQDMLRQDQVRFLGLIGVTALLAACLTHMLDLGSSDEDVRDASAFRLYQSLQVLESLREVYASADSAVSFLVSVTRKAGISLPLHGAPSGATAVTGATSSRSVPHHDLGRAMHRTESRATVVSGARTSEPSNARWSVNGFRSGSQSTANRSQPSALSVGNGRSILAEDPPQHPTRIEPQSSQGAGYRAPNELLSGTVVSLNGNSDSSLSSYGLASNYDVSQNLSNVGPAGSALSWNIGIDSEIDLAPMSFNYDFFSDALGFLDGDLQYM